MGRSSPSRLQRDFQAVGQLFIERLSNRRRTRSGMDDRLATVWRDRAVLHRTPIERDKWSGHSSRNSDPAGWIHRPRSNERQGWAAASGALKHDGRSIGDARAVIDE